MLNFLDTNLPALYFLYRSYDFFLKGVNTYHNDYYILTKTVCVKNPCLLPFVMSPSSTYTLLLYQQKQQQHWTQRGHIWVRRTEDGRDGSEKGHSYIPKMYSNTPNIWGIMIWEKFRSKHVIINGNFNYKT